MKLTTSGEPDMRYKENREYEARQRKHRVVAAIVLGVLAGIIGTVSIWRAVNDRPMLDTKGGASVEGEVMESAAPNLSPPPTIDIVEDYKTGDKFMPFYERMSVPTVAPRPTVILQKVRQYSHYDHAHKPRYQDIMYLLQNMYVEFEDAAELIARESGFNPFAVNPSSGACGLVQSYPCHKMGCELSDIKCQLEWQKQYIAKRYGTVAKALKWHDQYNWY